MAWGDSRKADLVLAAPGEEVLDVASIGSPRMAVGEPGQEKLLGREDCTAASLLDDGPGSGIDRSKSEVRRSHIKGISVEELWG